MRRQDRSGRRDVDSRHSASMADAPRWRRGRHRVHGDRPQLEIGPHPAQLLEGLSSQASHSHRVFDERHGAPGNLHPTKRGVGGAHPALVVERSHAEPLGHSPSRIGSDRHEAMLRRAADIAGLDAKQHQLIDVVLAYQRFRLHAGLAAMGSAPPRLAVGTGHQVGVRRLEGAAESLGFERRGRLHDGQAVEADGSITVRRDRSRGRARGGRAFGASLDGGTLPCSLRTADSLGAICPGGLEVLDRACSGFRPASGWSGTVGTKAAFFREP